MMIHDPIHDTIRDSSVVGCSVRQGRKFLEYGLIKRVRNQSGQDQLPHPLLEPQLPL